MLKALTPFHGSIGPCAPFPYRHTLCSVAVTWRIAEVKSSLLEPVICVVGAISVSSNTPVRIISPTAKKFDSFFQAGTLVRINIFFCRNRKKIHIAIQLVPYFRISHGNRAGSSPPSVHGVRRHEQLLSVRQPPSDENGIRSHPASLITVVGPPFRFISPFTPVMARCSFTS